VRHAGEPPIIKAVAPDELGPAVAAAVSAVAVRWPLTGVVVPEALHAEVTDALLQAAVSFRDGSTASALGEHITVLSPSAVKGLEFDAVVLVEPEQLVAEAAGNLRLLYVALTRAVHHLTVVHARPLPVLLADPPSGTDARRILDP
jgi:DNA helicase IV